MLAAASGLFLGLWGVSSKLNNVGKFNIVDCHDSNVVVSRPFARTPMQIRCKTTPNACSQQTTPTQTASPSPFPPPPHLRYMSYLYSFKLMGNGYTGLEIER